MKEMEQEKFGSGSRTPVAITVLIKKKGIKKDGFIKYYVGNC